MLRNKAEPTTGYAKDDMEEPTEEFDTSELDHLLSDQADFNWNCRWRVEQGDMTEDEATEAERDYMLYQLGE